jgi:hypothetical protein
MSTLHVDYRPEKITNIAVVGGLNPPGLSITQVTLEVYTLWIEKLKINLVKL